MGNQEDLNKKYADDLHKAQMEYGSSYRNKVLRRGNNNKNNKNIIIIVVFLLFGLLIWRGCNYDPESNNQIGDYFETLIGLAIVIAIIYFLGKAGNARNQKIEKLKDQYDNALRGTNKAAALTAGRAYYAALRGPGKSLTIYDEQAIGNDIATMKS